MGIVTWQRHDGQPVCFLTDNTQLIKPFEAPPAAAHLCQETAL